jgi:hypothetical protein
VSEVIRIKLTADQAEQLSTPAEPQKLDVTLRRVEGNRSAYHRLVRHRFLCGLLTPFRCAKCRNWALDPIGRNAKHSFLCQSCTDPAQTSGNGGGQ